MRLNLLGRIANEYWLDILHHFPNIELLTHVVMPNRLHGLFVIHAKPRARHAVPLQTIGGPAEAYRRPVAGSVPTIVRSFKSAASKRIREILRWPDFETWQRNYYESRIRNAHEARNARRYILENPARWHTDRHNPEATAATLDFAPEGHGMPCPALGNAKRRTLQTPKGCGTRKTKG
jgi:putative transposase